MVEAVELISEPRTHGDKPEGSLAEADLAALLLMAFKRMMEQDNQDAVTLEQKAVSWGGRAAVMLGARGC